MSLDVNETRESLSIFKHLTIFLKTFIYEEEVWETVHH